MESAKINNLPELLNAVVQVDVLANNPSVSNLIQVTKTFSDFFNNHPNTSIVAHGDKDHGVVTTNSALCFGGWVYSGYPSELVRVFGELFKEIVNTDYFKQLPDNEKIVIYMFNFSEFAGKGIPNTSIAIHKEYKKTIGILINPPYCLTPQYFKTNGI